VAADAKCLLAVTLRRLRLLTRLRHECPGLESVYPGGRRPQEFNRVPLGDGEVGRG
jgi:hypothetical protein